MLNQMKIKNRKQKIIKLDENINVKKVKTIKKKIVNQLDKIMNLKKIR